MKKITYILMGLFLFSFAFAEKIDRKSVVTRHNFTIPRTIHDSPSQVGNGNFAFCVDISGMQSFIPFNTLSHWAWHSVPAPDGRAPADFKGEYINVYGKKVLHNSMNSESDRAMSIWMEQNQHRFNLGRAGLEILKKDGTIAQEHDLKDSWQNVDLWTGVLTSGFTVDGERVVVKTASDASRDAVGIKIESPLLEQGRIRVFFNFPYGDNRYTAEFVGERTEQFHAKHTSKIVDENPNFVRIDRVVDELKYSFSLNWAGKAKFEADKNIVHKYYLSTKEDGFFEFVFEFEKENKKEATSLTFVQVESSSIKGWEDFWMSGAAVDMSESSDPRWRELERRTVLSQYQMKLNEAGDYPPQESGLNYNSWYGRYHLEMHWWHIVHYALWDRWELARKSLNIYTDFLPTAKKRAEIQGYKGARWPKSPSNNGYDWPFIIHATLIWQQPHPIYFAEQDYRLNPSKETLEKWKEIVFESADFMASFAHYDETEARYVLGPPVFIVSENTNPHTTINPTFELGYWRYGLRVANQWRERLGLERNKNWDDVLKKLAVLPEKDGVYHIAENVLNTYTDMNYEHPALIGVYGMLPGDGVDLKIFNKTVDKVFNTWQLNRTWGWDFPMLSMAATRTGRPNQSVAFLLFPSHTFGFNTHGLTGRYYPSNGGFLAAIAMMIGGWDGSEGDTPGFPKDGSWIIKHEGFRPMQ